jgi:hypothetical protein
MTTRISEFRIFRTTFVLILFGLISASSPAAFGAEHKGKVKPYPLDYCIMDGKPLGDNPTTFVYKGQEIKVDTPECKDAFMQDPDLNLKKVQEAARKQKKSPAKGQGSIRVLPSMASSTFDRPKQFRD